MNLFGKSVIAAAALSACGAAHAQDTLTLNFARVGQSYSAFIGSGNPAVGRRIISAHILLTIDPDAGNDAAIVFTGEGLGWSGLGTFQHDVVTEAYNGTVIARRYGAETPGEGFDGSILEGSMIELQLEPAGCPADFNQD